MDESTDEGPNKIGMIPAAIFTGGLDMEQEMTLHTIGEALDRGERYIFALANGDEKMQHEYEPLHRLLTGLADGAALPIAKRVMEGAHPVCAIKEVIAGVGGLMFFAGIEYAKSMGLNGVGVPLPPKKTYAEDEYPEQKPAGNPSLSEFMKMSGIDVDDLDDDGRRE